jgi:hypothetical protein
MDDYDRQYYEKQFPDEITDSDGTRMVMRHDIAYVMAARAEQGYGLDNVSGRNGTLELAPLLTSAPPQCRRRNALPQRRQDSRYLGIRRPCVLSLTAN